MSWWSRLRGHQGFRRYLGNTAWLGAEQGLRMVAGLVVGIWVARYLGPEQFGLLSFAIAFAALFAGIAKLGMDQILVREFIAHPDQQRAYLGTAWWLKVAAAAIAIGLIMATLPLISSDGATTLYVLIIALGLVFQSFEVVEFYFQSQVLARVISICKTVQLLISSLAKIALVLFGAELVWFVVLVLVDAITLAMSYAIAYVAQGRPSFLAHFRWPIARRLLRDCWPLIFAGVVVMIFMRIDQVMIKAMLGEHEVGVYSVAVRLSETLYAIPALLMASLFPAVLNARSVSREQYLLRLRRFYTLMIWLAIGLAIPLSLMAEWLVVLLFGEEYRAVGPVLQIHVWSSIFVFLSFAFAQYLVAENLTGVAFMRTLVGAVLNIVLNLYLIPRHGIEGAAIATLLAQGVANFLYDCFDRRLHGQFVLKCLAFLLPFGRWVPGRRDRLGD